MAVNEMHMRVVAAGVMATVIAGPAFGQQFERERNVSVTERPRPEYDPLGKRIGGFTAFPALRTGLLYDDNIFADPANTESATILRTTADLRIASNWSVHALELRTGLGHDEFFDQSTEDATEVTLQASGRLDVRRSTAIGGGANYQSLTEDRTDPNSPRTALKPVRYETSGFQAFAARESGRLQLRGELDWRELDYRDVYDATGFVIDQDFRDRDLFTARLRSAFAISPATALFIEGAYDTHSYKLPSATLTSRDSDTYSALAGVNFDITELMRGEVALGYSSRSFDDPTISDSGALAARAGVEWFPTPLLTLNFTASRTEESSDALLSPGVKATSAGVSADYEFLRNLILGAGVSYAEEDYKGIDRTDSRWVGFVSAEYLLNRNIGIEISYNYLDQESSGLASTVSSYDRNRIGLTLLLQY